MADPFRLKIMKKLTECLQQITPENGYIANLSGDGLPENGGWVCRGRIEYGDEEALPLVSILEPPIPLEVILSRGDNTYSAGKWELLVQGFVIDDKRNPSDPAHILMAQVKQRLILEKRRDRGMDILGMGGRVTEMEVGQGAVRPADQVSTRCFFWLTLSLSLAEDLANPYE